MKENLKKYGGIALFVMLVVAGIWFVKNYERKIMFHGLEYKVITSPETGRVWLDRNIGALQACTSLTDEKCYGDYIQWGRPLDGHEKSDSFTVSERSNSITPSDGKFITDEDGGDWSKVDTDGKRRGAFWASVNGEGVCPEGFRVPTEKELTLENFNSLSDMFLRLKIPLAGYRHYSSASVYNQGLYGNLWSSTADTDEARDMYITAGGSGWGTHRRGYGFSLRCVESED